MGKLRASLFLKLSLVLLLSGVLISLVFREGMFRAVHPPRHDWLQLNAEHYARYLVGELGVPPKFEKGKALLEARHLRMRIDGNGWRWSSSPELPSPVELPRAHGPKPPLLHLVPKGRHHDPFVVIDYTFADGPAKVLLMAPQRPELEPDYRVMIALLAIVGAIIAGTYFLIRWILGPIRTLSRGVEALSAGRLDYRVPEESTDELGGLARAFNSMADRVAGMLRSKEQLLLDVSHELRSPLTRAKVGLELLDDGETTRRIGEDLRELEQMIEQLLEAARLESGKSDLRREPTDLVALARHVAEGRPVSIAAPASATLGVDPDRLSSVIRNLVDNAVKYSPDGSLTELRIVRENDGVRIEVRDRGIGIPQAELVKVFEPFYRVDKSRTRQTGGFGLGLSLCKRIVEAHGGTIAIRSEVGAGTTVTIFLPEFH